MDIRLYDFPPDYFGLNDTYNPFTKEYIPKLVENRHFNIPSEVNIEGQEWIAISTGLVIYKETDTQAFVLKILDNTQDRTTELKTLKLTYVTLDTIKKPNEDEAVYITDAQGYGGIFFIHSKWANKIFTIVRGSFITTTVNVSAMKTAETPLYINPHEGDYPGDTGRNLLDVLGAKDVKDCFQKLKTLSTTGDFTKLRLGDWIDLKEDSLITPDSPDGNWYKIAVIVAFNHYQNCLTPGYTQKPHITFNMKNLSYIGALDHRETVNYYATTFYTRLNGDLLTMLQNIIGVQVLPFSRRISQETGKETLFISSSDEIRGNGFQTVNMIHNGAYRHQSTTQYPFYVLRPDESQKFRYGKGYYHYWAANNNSYAGNRDMTSIITNEGCIGMKLANESMGINFSFNI